MNKITLIKKVKVVNRLKKSQADLFRNTKEGDILTFVVTIEGMGRTKRGSYAKTLRIINETTNDYTVKTFNEIERLLAKFELEEI